jgi:hypothetical protein
VHRDQQERGLAQIGVVRTSIEYGKRKDSLCPLFAYSCPQSAYTFNSAFQSSGKIVTHTVTENIIGICNVMSQVLAGTTERMTSTVWKTSWMGDDRIEA